MNIIRPFPIGWDDMGIYMNIPKIIGQTGELVQGINAYNWSLFMSSGFILFNSTEVAMGLSLIGGIFSLGAIYKLARKYVSKFSSLFLVTIFYTLPSIVFQSRMDMKVDLGLLFVSAVILLLIFDFIELFRNKQNDIKTKPAEKKDKKKRQSKGGKDKLISKQAILLALLIGVLAGFAFGIKYTSFILLVAVFATVAFSFYRIWGLIIVGSIGIFFTFMFELFSYSGVEFSEKTILFTKIISLALSVIALLVVIVKKFQTTKVKHLAITFFLITCGIFISFGPWVVKNYIETKEISVEGLLYGESQRPTFDFTEADQKYDEYVNEQVKEDESKKESGLTQKLNFKSSGQYETVTIYSGYEEGILRYLSLPYDVVMNTNNHPRLTALFDISYLLLAILPVLVLAVLKDKYPQLAVGLFLVLIIGFLFISYISVIGRDTCIEKSIDTQCIQQVVSQYSNDSNSILRFVNYIVILAAPLLTLLYKLFSSLTGIFIIFFVFSSIGIFFLLITKLLSKNRKIQSISVFSAVYLSLWLILGNGLYWYGMIGFVILFLMIFVLQSKLQRDNRNPVITFIVKLSVFLWVVLASFSMFLVKDRESTHLFRPYNARYMIGQYKFDDVLGEISPHFVEAKNELNSNPDALVYRVGTMLTYFIDDNYKRVLKDNDLQVFHRLYKSSRSKEEIATKMYLEGYRYILASFGGMNLDVTEGKTLTKKFKAFEEFISNNPKLELVTTDRLVIDETGEYELEINGKVYKVSKKIEGEVINPGDVILLKIIE
ncbi:hypothetical protein GF362_07720 [Candidatus Dojkabacteria bacterium]|nr:hypothetical protein [Candidatus Dojkabacteria bacterium]